MDSIQKILLNRTTTKPAKATFKSFVTKTTTTTTNGGGESGGVSSSSLSSSDPDNSHTDVANAAVDEVSIFYDQRNDSSSEIVLQQGEILISKVEDVLQTLLYSLDKNDPHGTLVVTNFRVIFIPRILSTTNESKSCAGRQNKLIGREDIALSNIWGIYQLSKGKRKKLLPYTFMSGIVKRLQLHCKDFRFHQFCFKNSFQDHVKVLVNAILIHFYPAYVEKLFAFSYNSPGSDANLSSVKEFLTAEDWEDELSRIGVSKYAFAVSNCNKDFILSESLPESFVLPTSLTDATQLKKANVGPTNRCLPVWSYSHNNGCALIRMASGCHETEDEMRTHVSRSHPKLNPPELFDLGCANLPTLKKLQVSFEDLMEICMPSTYKELVNSDNLWYGALDLCQWLYHVSCALSVAKDVAEAMCLRGKSVVIKERDGTDFNALISALAQLLLDQKCRTIYGFQTLVEKEFVALGHRFSQRCHVVSSKDAEQSPLFLLFLDCTWQLLQQFPSAFEFTEIFLISIWDSVGLGIFRNFIFDGPKERTIVEASIEDNCSFPMNVWEWKKQFDPEDITFFTNPVYSAVEQIRIMQRAKKNPSSRILVPCCALAGLKFWENCYLRWITPIQIIGGGKPSEIITQGLLMEEITCLQGKISELEDTVAPELPTTRRQKALKFVFGDSSSLLRHKLSKHVSSSYPFSPPHTLTHTLLLPVPSPDSRSSCNEDTLSVDDLNVADATEL